MSEYMLNADEDICALTKNGYRLIQKKKGFRFSIDAVLLAHFPALKAELKVLDLGSGNGVLPLLLKDREPSLKISGVEIQEASAQLARRNMTLNQAEVEIYNLDLRALPKDWGSSFDLIITNPPFFPLGTGKINPLDECAAARHELYCTLEELLQSAKRLLKPHGRLAMIYKPERLSQLCSLCQAYQLAPKYLQFIHPYSNANANLFLLEAIKGGRNALEVLPPLVVYQKPGVYTPEILAIYGGIADE